MANVAANVVAKITEYYEEKDIGIYLFLFENV